MWMRRCVHAVLSQLASRYELVLCTQGSAEYADAMARLLDPQQSRFAGRVHALLPSDQVTTVPHLPSAPHRPQATGFYIPPTVWVETPWPESMTQV